jgi:hypothetical protein
VEFLNFSEITQIAVGIGLAVWLLSIGVVVPYIISYTFYRTAEGELKVDTNVGRPCDTMSAITIFLVCLFAPIAMCILAFRKH